MSDSVGETADLVARAAASQFNAHAFDIVRFPHVEDSSTVLDIISQARCKKSVIVYTIILPELRELVRAEAERYGIPAVDIMGPMLRALSETTTIRPKMMPGLVRRMDEDYFKRVEAVEFAVKSDDGKDPGSLVKADVVIVGVSRTSKTPVSLYLANRQWKVANIPLVPEVKIPEELFMVPKHKIVGLTISENSLRRIRMERLRAMGLPVEADYAGLERIAAEIKYAGEVFKMLGCPVVDVSDKAVEETANTIIKYVTRGGSGA